MSDELARVTGASDIIKVGRTKYKASPLSLCQLQELQRSALRYYQDQYMEAFSNGLKYLDNGSKDDRIVEENRKVSAWDIADLPKKEVYSVRKSHITKELKEHITKEFGIESEDLDDKRFQAIAEAALDAGKLKVDKFKELSGSDPDVGHVPYDSHWITSNFDGMCEFIWVSLRIKHHDLELDTVRNWKPYKVMEAARKVEAVVSPAMGNM